MPPTQSCSSRFFSCPSPAPTFVRLAAIALMLALVGGCDLGSGPPPAPSSLLAVAGEQQTATVATAVSVAPAVRVLGKKGKPLSKREVIFSVVEGGGTITEGVAKTDQEGMARVGSWVLGTSAGPNRLEARVEGLPAITFSATGTAGSPSSVQRLSTEDQTGVVGAAVATSPSVAVKDAYGNPVPDEPVEFRVLTGGGEVDDATVSTDPGGVATVGSWILGTTPGSNTLAAYVQGLSPLGFSASGEADSPAIVSAFRGDGQVGTVGRELPVSPAVRVTDQYGNLLAGVPVIYSVASGGGIIGGEEATTDAFGIAPAGPWTLGTVAGPQTLSVQVPNLEPLLFSALAEASDPAAFQANGGNSQSATVGTQVPVPPAILVQDEYGNPVPGVSVTFAETSFPEPAAALPLQLSGVVEGEEATTGADGVASVGSWTLGTVAGAYVLTALVEGLDGSVTFSAQAMPDTPSSLLKVAGDEQSSRTETPVPVAPTVRVVDRYGNGIGGLDVAFSVLEGGGSLEGGVVQTDDHGMASVGGWTLGPLPGPNRLTATVSGLGTVTFGATGLTALPVSIAKIAGDHQSATVGATVAVRPTVKVLDGGGEGVPYVVVTFSIGTGGGSAAGLSVVTGSDGTASVGSWEMGTTPGTNTLFAAVEDLSPVTFSATAIAGPPTEMVLNGGDGQAATVSTPVATPPSVVLRDQYGNRVPGVAVSFAVTAGGGMITGTPAISNHQGVAAPTTWTMGPSPGLNAVSASLAGLPPVNFTATATATPPEGEFTIDLQFMTSIDATQEAVFRAAAARWEEVIVGDIPDFGGTLSVVACQPVEESAGIDDVKIYVSVLSIDGEGGILGQAGPCYYWTPSSVFPITGIMRLDEADLANMQANGTLEDVIIHEMGHVLGFGTLWMADTNELLADGGTLDPYFPGTGAVAAFDAAGGSGRTGPKVPVENTGGPGTRDAHWRESVHNGEIMTGWIEAPGTPNPLSVITIASLADMGYTVDMGAADPYVLYDPLAAFRMDAGPKMYLQELPPPVPIPAGGSGP